MSCRTMQLVGCLLKSFCVSSSASENSSSLGVGTGYGIKGKKNYLENQEAILMRTLGSKDDLLQFFYVINVPLGR